MNVNHLQLKQFRNYKELSLDFNSKINILYGNNAQGKTNILEALYLLALAKSHRNTKDKELVQWGQSFSVISGSFEIKSRKIKLEIQLTDKGKKAKINNLEKRKLSEYIGTFNVIMFGPEDLYLIKGSPQYRRRFLDLEIGQISPSYLYNLSQYQKIIQQRNNLLKDFSIEKKNKLELLEIWDSQLILYGAKIISKRINFLKKLEKWANNIHSSITDNTENLSVQYKPSIKLELKSLNEIKISEFFEECLKKHRQQEIYRGTTLIGPQRDDLEFYLNDINVQSFGSQGQQRTTALSLKLAEIELIKEEIGEYPILLLDDVFSELDQKRKNHLIKTIENKVQTIITTTSAEDVDKKILSQSSLFYVENGTITIK